VKFPCLAVYKSRGLLDLNFFEPHNHPTTRLKSYPLQAPTMHLLAYLSTGLSLFSLSTSLPSSQPRHQHCNALIETSPWHVSSIVVYNAEPAAPVGSSIHFQVSDTNPGLEFDTFCGVSMPAHTGSKPEDAQGWHPCEDGRVRFSYQLGSLQLSRSYDDDW
jgi:hypothetical protein